MFGVEYLSRFKSKLIYLSNQRAVKYGLPFFVIIIGGSFYLEQFSIVRYKYGKQRGTLLSPEELKKEGIEVKDRSETTLEKEFAKIQILDIDNWEQIRGPRPWENNDS